MSGTNGELILEMFGAVVLQFEVLGIEVTFIKINTLNFKISQIFNLSLSNNLSTTVLLHCLCP